MKCKRRNYLVMNEQAKEKKRHTRLAFIKKQKTKKNMHTNLESIWYKNTFSHPMNIVPVFYAVLRLPESRIHGKAVVSTSYFVSIAALSSLSSSQNEAVVRRS